jgi:membrane protein
MAWVLTRQAVEAWIDDRAPSKGAALAYYTLFSMAPLLLIVISVAGLIFGADAARGEIVVQLRELMGDTAADAIQQLLESVNWPAGGVWATLVGIGLMLLGATTVVAELQSTLDHIWRAPQRPEQGVWQLLRARLMSFGLILGVGFLLMVSLVFSAALSALQRWWAPWFGPWELWAAALNLATSFGLMSAMFAMIYKLMPRVQIAWSDVWVGAVVTALLFSLGPPLIGLYIGHSAVASGFGAAGSMVVVLIWIYYSAQIFLLGAEFTWVYAHQLGSRRHSLPARSASH